MYVYKNFTFLSLALLFSSGYSMQNITLEQIQNDSRYREINFTPGVRSFEMIVESNNRRTVKGLMFDEQGRLCGNYTNDHESELVHNGSIEPIENIQVSLESEPLIFTEPVVPEHIFNNSEVERQPEQQVRNNQQRVRQESTASNKNKFAYYGAAMVGVGVLAYIVMKLCSNEKDTVATDT